MDGDGGIKEEEQRKGKKGEYEDIANSMRMRMEKKRLQISYYGTEEDKREGGKIIMCDSKE